MRVALARQVQVRVGGAQVARAARAIRDPADRHFAKDARQHAVMVALGAATIDPVGIGHLIKARLARRAQIKMVLQQQPQQLAAIAIDQLLKLGMLQRAARHPPSLPTNASKLAREHANASLGSPPSPVAGRTPPGAA